MPTRRSVRNPYPSNLDTVAAGWYIDEVEIWKGVPQFVNPEGFEFGWGDWHADNGVWQIGKPTSGPSAAHAGTSVAGTNLAGNLSFSIKLLLSGLMVTWNFLKAVPVFDGASYFYIFWFVKRQRPSVAELFIFLF